ncbi:adhesion G protein-coupled receptor L3-like isoform X2 [Anneissia japonica]|uniref:adhesion G protein-coupled receptor L3-like isoform X2 n=1 Tax=Anneissia japonica TaxID=1529436 RepID=UPI001425A14A|nr:adhesion G protein-coupled receptor L3-like isoform X2 [Anneissia japonica]
MNYVRYTVLVAAFAITAAVTVSDKTVTYPELRCPNLEWRMFEGKCYNLYQESLTWYEAEKRCKIYGADLVLLKNEKLNDFAVNLAASISSSIRFIWMGLTDRETEGEFKWNDGTDLVYNNWGSVEPNNRGTDFQPNADCVLLYINGMTGEWKDKSCEETLFYMCMKNATSGSTTTFVSTPVTATQPVATVSTKENAELRLADLTNKALSGNLTVAEATDVAKDAIDTMQSVFNSPTSDTDKMDITEKAEELFVALSASVEVGESITIDRDNIVAELHHLSSSDDLDGLTFKASGYNTTNSTPPSLTFDINGARNDEGDVNVAVIYYDRKIFSSSNGNDDAKIVRQDDNRNNGKIMNVTMVSGVISATASTAKHKIPVMVDFTLPKDVPKTTNQSASENATTRQAVCSYWNITARGWSTKGCRVVSGSDVFAAETRCSCSHTTNFAVLMQVSDVPINDRHRTALEWITRIGCSISLAGLFISLGVYIYLEDLRKLERNLIHINLMVSLIIVQFLFLLGIDRTENKDACTAIAICLHFFLMAVFSWMLVEGIYLHFKLLRRTAVNKSKLPYYLLIGYGVPVVTVAFTAGFGFSGYGTDKSCWLSTANGHIWAFVGPALAIILVNIITLFFVVKLIFQRSSRRKSESQHAVTAAKGAFILLPILGLTWLFGILSVNDNTIIFQYLFVIFNSLQGLSIFLVYCVFNTEVRTCDSY